MAGQLDRRFRSVLLTPGTELGEIRAAPRRGDSTNVEIVPGLTGCQAPLPSTTPCR